MEGMEPRILLLSGRIGWSGTSCLLTLSVLAYIASGQQGGFVGPRRPFVLTQDTPPRPRCVATLDTWCMEYHMQPPVPWKPAPRGSKSCPKDCLGIGNCNYDWGYCECPAGRTGEDCGTIQKRGCVGDTRNPDAALDSQPMTHVGPDGRDINPQAPGGAQSRCGGICDDDIAMCWCDGPIGRIPKPANASFWDPPIRRGRPMTTPMCQPNENEDGSPRGWGDQPWSNVYGDRGWCQADKPKWSCPCIIDGLDGPLCEDVVEAFCVNQCSGHGECHLGYCRCDPGWYGTDCSRKKAGEPLEPGRIPQHEWLRRDAVEPPAALEHPGGKGPERKRPLVYIYDLEPLYNSKLLQYRIPSSWCVHRRYTLGNVTHWTDLWVYAVESLFHELLSVSEHRTFDPEEADFFYVPAYTTCYPFPIMGWADFPWFGAPGFGIRVYHAANLILEAKRWVQEKFPYWNRRGGRDHIFLFLHDEGACWAPNELTPAIWLTHWGRLEANHTSNTAFVGDNYNTEFEGDLATNQWEPGGWTKKIKGHVCYDPKKDLIIPSFKSPRHYRTSPLMGELPKARDILLFFKGDVGKHRLPNYSRGVRQKLYKMSKQLGWDKRPHLPVRIGDGRDIPEDYSEMLSRSRFCLVAAGDGWSARAEDAVLHGCVPVVISDGVHQVFESILDWEKFGIRIKEADIEKTEEILMAVSEQRLRSLQAHLSRVWHRFRWLSGPALANDARPRLQGSLAHTDKALREMRVDLVEEGEKALLAAQQQAQGQAQDGAPAGDAQAAGDQGEHGDNLEGLIQHPRGIHLPRPFRGDPTVDDAFSTIMQWLHSRIRDTRAPAPEAAGR